MSYTREYWRDRYASRTDLSTSVIHLTRGTPNNKVYEVLFKILSEEQIKGSTTKTGHIVGKNKAVCFQDIPMTSVGQNCHFEKKLRKQNSSTKSKIRYLPCGICFDKSFVYKKGGRPVIYEETSIAKEMLDEEEWWRIVNFNLSNKNAIIDWTHEREWRVKGDFRFKRKNATLILSGKNGYKNFMKYCEDQESSIYQEVAGIVTLANVLF